MSTRFVPGDPVVYTAPKASTHPGPRAINVSPSEMGELYRYEVEKYWRVAEVRQDGKVVLLTRRGKRRVCSASDRRLRKAGFVDRLRNRNRFPEVQMVESFSRAS